MRVLDLDGVPPQDRAEALRSALLHGLAPCSVELTETADVTPPGRVDLWRFGRSSFMATDTPALRLRRTDRHCSAGTAPIVSLAVVRPRGRAWLRHFGHERVLRRGDLVLDDVSAPEEFESEGSHRCSSYLMNHDELALPMDLVRRAAIRLPASPLYRLVRGHLAALSVTPDEVLNGPAATGVARATAELARALIATAVEGSPHGRQALADTLVTRTLTYARQHLREGDLTPARLAAAQHVSVRRLFSACAQAGISLEQWIIGERLAAAHVELAAPTAGHRSVTAIAHHWGFSSASHFSRRFRDSYGMSPSTWQRESLSTAGALRAGQMAPERVADTGHTSNRPDVTR
jgi:AraC-like DNA-binding protein